jgi:hypothetical protein
MTDHPRFRITDGDADQRHRHHHGAAQVELFFRLVDTWRAGKWRSATRVPVVPRPAIVAANITTHILRTAARKRSWSRTTLRWLGAMGFGLMVITGTPSVAQDTVRIRGTIETEVGGIYSVRTRDNRLVTLKLAPSAGVAASVKSSLSDIRPGLYIGIAALPQADGSLRALEAHIFDETMRGTAEGHRAWDLLPKSTMTNAVVDDIVRAIDGHTVTLRYKDGQQRVKISPDTVVVTYLPGNVTELKVGSVIFVPGAAMQPDGTLVAQRVMVGRNVPPPQ